MVYEERKYREWVMGSDLVSFCVTVKETDLYIGADKDLKRKVYHYVVKCRQLLESYIKHKPEFMESLVPLDMEEGIPPLIASMYNASTKAGVGPFAAVAGAVAEDVGRYILKSSSEVIVENGGDIFLQSKKTRRLGIYAGESKFTGKLAIELEGNNIPWGVATSSGTVGHSLSFGKADAAIIVSHDAAVSDAFATAVGNIVKTESDIEKALEFAKSCNEIIGAVVIVNDKIGAWGEIKLVELMV